MKWLIGQASVRIKRTLQNKLHNIPPQYLPLFFLLLASHYSKIPSTNTKNTLHNLSILFAFRLFVGFERFTSKHLPPQHHLNTILCVLHHLKPCNVLLFISRADFLFFVSFRQICLAYFRDTTGASHSIKGIRINVCDVDWRPPQTMLARKMLTEAVTTVQCERTKQIRIDGLIKIILFNSLQVVNLCLFADKTHIDVPIQENWFHLWRETFFTVQFPTEHEFTRHFLGCLIVLCSSDANPLESAQQLTGKVQMMQNVTPSKLPKWFAQTDLLNCYVMLHDACQGDISK